MSRQRFFLLALAALIVLSAGFFFANRRDHGTDTTGGALLPALADQVNAVTALTIRKGAATPSVTVHKTGTSWSVAERADYPADVTKIRKLLLSLKDARIVEYKTADPARFAAIGLEDPGTAAAAGTEVTIVTPNGTQGVIVGKPAGEGSFVRRKGEQQSFSVEPSIAVETEPARWIDAPVLDLPVANIQTIDVKPSAGPAYVLHRADAAAGTFTLDGVPAGRKALDGAALAPGPTAFSTLTADDVAPAASVDVTHGSHVTVTSSDGNVVTLTGAVVGDKHWIEISATKDATLTAKASGRAFQVASYRYDGIFRPLEQLLAPKDSKTPPSKSPATAKHAAAS